VPNNTADSDADGSGSGGGVAQQAGTFNLANSLVAGNLQVDPFGSGGTQAVDDDCLSELTSLGNNLIVATNGAACTVNGVFSQAFPLIGPLANNGGPTRTHALRPESPGIDDGNAAGCTNWDSTPLTRDQRGVARPLFGRTSARCDLGALEYVGPIYIPAVVR
jgi:hypothetical protein